MKLLASAAAAVCVLALVVVAAPALSRSPYRPKPVETELSPGPHDALGSPLRSGGYVSRPLRVRKRFNLVGMRWRGRAEPGIAVRTRRGDGRWTTWTTLYAHSEDGPDPGSDEPELSGMSMPAWVGEADQVQYRMSRRVPGLKLHFVNVRGTSTPADRLRTAIRGTASTAAASVARVLGGGDARAGEPQPSIVSRAGWGGDSCQPREAPSYGSVKAAFIHHTVNANDYTREEAPSVVLAICRYHRNSNGWDDIGYNFLVDKYGTLYEGRAGGIGRAVVGAQAQGYNAQTTGIANIGDFRSVSQTPEALQAMARLIRWKLPIHGAPTSGSTTLVSSGGSSNRYPAGARVRLNRIPGHRDTGSTTCPGEALYAQLPQLRAMVGNVAPGPSLTARVRPRTVNFGRRTRFGGRLLNPQGAPLGRQTIAVQVRRGRRWRTVRRTPTNDRGFWGVRLKAMGNRVLRARFGGGAGQPAAGSARVRLNVRPRIRVTRVPAVGARRRTIRYRGRVSPRKRRLLQVLQVRRAGRWVTVGVKTLRARRGRFRGSFRPARRGLYRFYVSARRDRTTVRGRSRPQEVMVRRGGRRS